LNHWLPLVWHPAQNIPLLDPLNISDKRIGLLFNYAAGLIKGFGLTTLGGVFEAAGSGFLTA